MSQVHWAASPASQPLEAGFLHFFFCLLFQSSNCNLRPRLLLAGVAALEEPHLFWGANGLLEETLLVQKCLKWVVLPYIALFYDLGKRSLVKPHIEWKSSQCRIRNGPTPKGEQKSKGNTGFRAMYILLKSHIYEISCKVALGISKIHLISGLHSFRKLELKELCKPEWSMIYFFYTFRMIYIYSTINFELLQNWVWGLAIPNWLGMTEYNTCNAVLQVWGQRTEVLTQSLNWP